MASAKIKLAVVTGGHPFDNVMAFAEMFRSFAGVDAYIQHMEDFANDAGGVRGTYDVVMFYNMQQELPGEDGRWYEKATRKCLEGLGQTKQGIFVLHHGLVAWREYQPWSDMVGMPERKFNDYHFDQDVEYKVVDGEHPITRGLASWRMTDETYGMAEPTDVRVLIATEHPKSMKSIAWVRQYREAPVFCFQCGHDWRVFGNESFRKVVGRGVEWLAGR